MTRRKWFYGICICMLGVLEACGGRSTTTPTTTSTAPVAPRIRPTWIGSGQSNAAALFGGVNPATGTADWTPAMATYANVVGDWLGGQSIVAWDDVPGSLWDIGPQQLSPGLRDILRVNRNATAFLWSQGEADYGQPDGWYLGKEQDLIARVRAEIGNPNLLVVVIGLGPAYQAFHIITEQKEFCATDSHALYIDTSPFLYLDGIHLTQDGYQQLAAYIATRIPQ